MEPALVLTQESADTAGYAGTGPFTFPGFPGLYAVDQPVALRELEGSSDDEARERLEAKIADTFEDGGPLEWVEVEDGEGKAHRPNHAPTLAELNAARVDAVIEKDAGGKITTHADADKVAADLGFGFPEDPRPTVVQKVAAIDEIRASGTSSLATPLTTGVPDDTHGEPELEDAAQAGGDQA